MGELRPDERNATKLWRVVTAGKGKGRAAMLDCSVCGRRLTDEERARAHDLTIADRCKNAEGRRSQRTRVHVLMCDECDQTIEALLIPHLTGDEWDRAKHGHTQGQADGKEAQA